MSELQNEQNIQTSNSTPIEENHLNDEKRKKFSTIGKRCIISWLILFFLWFIFNDLFIFWIILFLIWFIFYLIWCNISKWIFFIILWIFFWVIWLLFDEARGWAAYIGFFSILLWLILLFIWCVSGIISLIKLNYKSKTKKLG